MNRSVVLGSVFLEGFLKYTGEDPSEETVKLWHAGFASGQAEKVASGACDGCMFRIGDRWRPICLPVDQDIADRYGLTLVLVNEEIWLVNSRGEELLSEMLSFPLNSSRWHEIRAEICGIKDIDIEYHLRQGYRGRTD